MSEQTAGQKRPEHLWPKGVSGNPQGPKAARQARCEVKVTEWTRPYGGVKAFLKAAYGRPLSKRERAAFDRIAGGRRPPRRKVRELICVASRRAGKGSIAGAVAAYESMLVHHALAPGEKGVVACLSPTTAQAAIVRDYALGVFTSSPILSREIADTTVEEIRLRNGVVITTLAADYRSLRGRTLLLAILDEAAFLHAETGKGSDIELARALLPGLATTGGMLIVLSSPYRRSGLLFERHRDFYGRDDDDVLVVAGASELFNPTLDPKMLAAARAADPQGAASEWGGLFREDSGALFDEETIEAAVDRSRPLELPPLPGVDYRMAIDASGGAAGGDVYAASIAHREGEAVVIDVVRGVAGKFDPVRLTRDFAALAKAYGIATVTGDRYAPQWVASAWAECGIVYETSALSQSAVYLEAVPLFARCLAQLPNHARLLRELRLLERRTQRNGRDVVDHRPGESDDYAAAVCGALVLASTARPSLWSRQSFGAPATIPHLAQIVFAVLVANSREIAACLFALTRDRTLYVVDTFIDPPSPQLFDNVLARLIDLKRTTCAECAVIFASSPMVAEFAKRAQPAHVIDDLFREGSDALALGAALHISQGRVRIAGEARARRDPLATYGSDDDPLRLAALAGIAITLDQDRTIRSTAA